jgi:hypothetical protein
MPKKAASGSSRSPSKTAFILGLPADLPAKEVVVRAKAKGFNATEGQVYSLRSYAKKKGAATKAVLAKPAPGPSKTSKGGRPAPGSQVVPAVVAADSKAQSPQVGRATSAREAQLEKQLIAMMVEIGLGQSEAIFDRARTRVLEFAKA